MNTSIKYLALVLILICAWLGLAACARTGEAAPQLTQIARPLEMDLPQAGPTSTRLVQTPTPGSASPVFPMFSPPDWWKTYSNPELGVEFSYPPEAVLETENGTLMINLPFNSGTNLEVKSITVDVQPVVEETCYSGRNWEGIIPINGADFKYFQDELWKPLGGLSFYPSDFVTFSGDLCYRIALRMLMRDVSTVGGNPLIPTPDRDDLDVEVMLNILSTFKINR